jgi:hypothetical protein
MVYRAAEHVACIIRADAAGVEAHVQTVRQQFRNQASACRRLGSPFTAMLLELAAERLDLASEVGRRVLTWPGDPRGDALALRFAGGLHALVLSGAAPALAQVYPETAIETDREALWAAVADALDTHGLALLRFLESPPQTNELARSAALLGGFLTVARQTGRPLALLEIGASAGLNLHWDAYAYALGDASWGAAAAPLRLMPTWRGPSPPPATVEVLARRGCDRRPIDPANAQDRLRLRAYVWADQSARLARLDAALDHAARQGVRIEQADAAEWLEARLEQRPPSLATVLFHSIVWQYLAPATQRRIEAAVEQAGAAATAGAPLAWLRLEPDPGGDHAELRLTTWPGRREQLLADADYHGRWVSWRAG